MLHFKEGHIDYNGVRPDGTYEPQTENRVYFSKLVEPAALTKVTRYRLTSHDDTAYGVERQPVVLGYKAKGTEFNGPDKQHRLAGILGLCRAARADAVRENLPRPRWRSGGEPE